MAKTKSKRPIAILFIGNSFTQSAYLHVAVEDQAVELYFCSGDFRACRIDFRAALDVRRSHCGPKDHRAHVCAREEIVNVQIAYAELD